VAREVTQCGRQATVLTADLARIEDVQRLSREAKAIFGHIDIVVNNAAVFFPTSLETLTGAVWKEVVRTNLTAPFLLSLELGRAMYEQRAGRIIQIADWSGRRPVPGYLPYCVAKGGLLSVTGVLAKALAPYVQVNAIAPGPVLLPPSYDALALRSVIAQTPLQRLGTAEDVARGVYFLAARGDFVTGATYMVDGGWLARVTGGTETAS
jgi:NAD(P)-dependent dehydrogenase (short-subunit alcohol dehydrogenase family)